MLTGTELGRAIEAARIKKGVSKKEMADHFGVKPPSIQGWVSAGTIGKDKLPALWAYFSDVVGPEHWGLRSYPGGDQPLSPQPAPVPAIEQWRVAADHLASHISRKGIEMDPELFLMFVDAAMADMHERANEAQAAAIFERLWPLIKRGQRHVNS